MPARLVTVGGSTSAVSTPSSVNCAKGGSSDPVVVSVSVAPYTAKGATGGLTVTFAKKALAKDAAKDAVEPSAGVTGYGEVVSFDVNTLSGFVYLTCDATMKATATVTVTLGGTAKAAYTGKATMSVVPKDKAVALTGDAAKVGPTTLATGGNAGVVSLKVTCPVAGTAWVQMWLAADPVT